MTTPKFTKKEQAKLAVVFQSLRDELKANLSLSGYNNDLGCGNCGDLSSFCSVLSRLEQAVGLTKKS
jgi:hypothetical protein